MRTDLVKAATLILLSLLISGAVVAEEKPAWIGVRLNNQVEGVRISRIFEGSPAAEAGLRAKDLIVGFNGSPVNGMRDLIDQIRVQDPGSWLPLTVERNGKELEIDIRLGKRPESVQGHKMRSGWIGVEAIDLPAKLRQHFGAPETAGVMISDIVEGSPAESAGFELGDVVYEIDGIPIRSSRALRERVRGGGVGNDSEFTVVRYGTEMVLEARIEIQPEKPDTP